MLFNHVGVGRFPHEDVRMHFHSPLPPSPLRTTHATIYHPIDVVSTFIFWCGILSENVNIVNTRRLSACET